MRSISDTRRILVYLRNAGMIVALGERCSRGASSSGRSCDRAGSGDSRLAGLVIGFMVNTSFFEDAGDYLVQRWILDAHVDHRVAVEDRAQHLSDARAFDLEVD